MITTTDPCVLVIIVYIKNKTRKYINGTTKISLKKWENIRKVEKVLALISIQKLDLGFKKD